MSKKDKGYPVTHIAHLFVDPRTVPEEELRRFERFAEQQIQYEIDMEILESLGLPRISFEEFVKRSSDNLNDT